VLLRIYTSQRCSHKQASASTITLSLTIKVDRSHLRTLSIPTCYSLSSQLNQPCLRAPAYYLLFIIRTSILFISSGRVHNNHALSQDCCDWCLCTREHCCRSGSSPSIYQNTYRSHCRSTSCNSVHCSKPGPGKRRDMS
jgi:hypothetical protein